MSMFSSTSLDILLVLSMEEDWGSTRRDSALFAPLSRLLFQVWTSSSVIAFLSIPVPKDSTRPVQINYETEDSNTWMIFQGLWIINNIKKYFMLNKFNNKYKSLMKFRRSILRDNPLLWFLCLMLLCRFPLENIDLHPLGDFLAFKFPTSLRGIFFLQTKLITSKVLTS